MILSSGSIAIRGGDMTGVEANKRPVKLVFQHLALFPMMDVKENIAFGLRRRGEKGSRGQEKSREYSGKGGASGYGDKRINQISGGQMQRVAIARCLVLEPVVLLLDEPLGALDLKLREHMKVELKKLQTEIGTTFVYITHDQSEAMVMSDYVAVMNKGHFEQIDTPQNLYIQTSHLLCGTVRRRKQQDCGETGPGRLWAILHPHTGEGRTSDAPPSDPSRSEKLWRCSSGRRP